MMTRSFVNLFTYRMIVVLVCLFLSACGNDTTSSDSVDYSTLEKGQTQFESAVTDGGDAVNNTVLYSDAEVAEDDEAAEADAQRVIEESDIIKVEGSLLYILNRYQGLFICNAQNPDVPVITGNVFVEGTPYEMYVRNGVAYVLASKPGGCVPVGDTLVLQDNTERQSILYVVSVSDPSDPYVIDSIDIKGWFTDSRIVGSILYTVTSYYSYTAGQGSAGQTLVCSIDISGDSDLNVVDTLDLADATQYIHVTDQAIFSVSNMGYYSSGASTITYIDISDAGGKMAKRGSIDVKGQVRDKFKLDYYDNCLRVCTYHSSSRLSILNTIDVSDPDQMAIRGSLELAKGETLFATRFDGDRAYVVTYLRIDPLWIIDLSDQEHPTIASELEVPGWSTHIETRGNRLVTLGVDDTDGWHVSVCLFDVEDPENPSEIDRLTFGEDNGWAWSEAYNDYRAFTILDDLGLILLPFRTYDNKIYAYVNKLQLIDYNVNDLETRGFTSQQGSIVRSGSISERLFSVSNDELCVIDASDRDNPVVSSAIPLAENVRKFIPLENGYGVKVIDKGDGSTLLRSVSLDNINGPGSGTINLVSSYSDVFGDGNKLVLMSSNSYDAEAMVANVSEEFLPSPWEGRSQLTVIDFSNPASPEKKGSLMVPGSYYSIYDPNQPNSINMSYGNRIHKMPNHVFLFHSQRYLYDADPSIANRAIAVDLTDADQPEIVSTYDFDKTIYHLFTKGSIVYFTYDTQLADNRMVRYYLGRVDMADPANPVKVKSVNIPGICLGVDTTGTIAYTLVRQYLADKSLQTYFCTLLLSNEQAMLLDSIAVNMISGLFLRDGSRFYFKQEQYYWACNECDMVYADIAMPIYENSESMVYTVDAAIPEDLELYTYTMNEDGCYKTLQRAFGKKLFASSAHAIMLYDASNPENFVMTDLEPVNAWFNSSTHTETAVYVSMGYNGLKSFLFNEKE